MCAEPVLESGIALTAARGRSQFCSQECKEKARERGICRYCLKEPDATFAKRLCGTCRQRRALTWRAIQDVNKQLLAMRRAKFLPYPYRRVD